MFFAVLGST